MTKREQEDEELVSRKEILVSNLCYLTRALVKNNLIKQNPYLILLTLEYLMMLYCTLRLADYNTFLDVFGPIELFLDVGIDDNLKLITLETQLNMEQQAVNKAYYHIYINSFITGIYFAGIIIFGVQLFKITNFDKTKETSYTLKFLSTFLVFSKTVLKIPVLTSIFLVIRVMMLNLAPRLQFLSIACVILLILKFLSACIFALKFLNMEVPNDEITWSYNQSGGMYFKLLLQIILCSQELYRGKLNERGVAIAILLVLMAIQVLILIYRLNTPNIFNQNIHNFTLFLEGAFMALSFIGLIALLTNRDIFSTLAYLFIFIPIMVKIIFSADQHRKHQILFKLKNEDGLSKNEYLICLTHVLKMIKRQSESDLAQLMSFTYQHKLSCYNTGCICQFFTQYCQDPQLFKKKKK